MADAYKQSASRRDATHDILYFLSHASNQTLGVLLVALGGVTYLVLGRVGLLLIGMVCGVALHAAWEGSSAHNHGLDAVDGKRRREVGLDVMRRILDSQERKRVGIQDSEGKDSKTESTRSSSQVSDFKDFQPATGAALGGLVDAIIRDYVKWWYAPMLPSDDSFPSACQQILTSFLLSFSSHLSRKRPADTFLNFVTHGTSIFIIFLGELSSALKDPAAIDLSVPDAIESYLEERPGSNLANLVDLTQQGRKFKLISNDILETFLDSKALGCEPVKVFLREILASLIFEMTLKSCSKSEFINEWIVYLLEDSEPEIHNAMDAGVERASGDGIQTAAPQEELDGNPLSDKDPVLSDNKSTSEPYSSHQRKLSKAEEAMEEAMLEAKRLSDLIASENARSGQPPVGNLLSSEVVAESSQALLDGKTNGATLDPSYIMSISPACSVYLKTQNSTTSNIAARRDATDASLPSTPSHTEMYGEGDGAELAGTSMLPHSTDEAPVTFDQFLTSQQLLSSSEVSACEAPLPLALYNARVTIFDDDLPGEKANNIIRSKPSVDYLLQVEPASSLHTGWMVARKYADFETLHEVLRQISRISGIVTFTHKYNILPTWKNQTKETLRQAIETYLRDALSDARLADCEGMKRFLEKEQGLGKPSIGGGKGLLAFPTPTAFEAMGKGMLDVLASAPKGAAGGGKALFEGVTGVFGQKKPSWPIRPAGTSRSASIGSFHRPKDNAVASGIPTVSYGNISHDVPRKPIDPEISHIQNMHKRTTTNGYSARQKDSAATSQSHILNVSDDSLPANSSTKSANCSTESFGDTDRDPELTLPPLPTEIADDYSSGTDSPRMSMSTDASVYRSPSSTAPSSIRLPPQIELALTTDIAEAANATHAKPWKDVPSLTEQETQVAVELFFAAINELYTLSSAWNFRRTILTAAKTFLLRPGNPQLEAIRVLIQDTVIDANTSDTGLAAQLLKIRENSLPTEAELTAWPPLRTEKEQATLRAKARTLLIEKGMPRALTSVMGAAASGEALGRVFDSLQMEKVARGLMFAFLLQGIRAVTH